MKTIEAFAKYHRQKELLTDYIQIGSASLSLLGRNINVSNAPSLMGELVDACSIPHWSKGKRYPEPEKKIASVETSLANFGIIQHTAAFDYFSRNIIVDAMKFSERARVMLPSLTHDHQLLILSPQRRWVMSPCCNEVVDRLGDFSDRLDKLKDWLGWMPRPALVATFPIFHLMRRIRNRITHHDGIVGSDLEEYASSQAVTDAITAFRNQFARGALPPLPTFTRGTALSLHAVHAVLCGAFLYEVAKDLNEHVAELLSVDEFIDMAFYFSSIVDEHPLRTIRHKSAESRINYFLTERYLRSRLLVNGQMIIRRLRSQSLISREWPEASATAWKVARERHEQLLNV